MQVTRATAQWLRQAAGCLPEAGRSGPVWQGQHAPRVPSFPLRRPWPVTLSSWSWPGCCTFRRHSAPLGRTCGRSEEQGAFPRSPCGPASCWPRQGLVATLPAREARRWTFQVWPVSPEEHWVGESDIRHDTETSSKPPFGGSLSSQVPPHGLARPPACPARLSPFPAPGAFSSLPPAFPAPRAGTSPPRAHPVSVV